MVMAVPTLVSAVQAGLVVTQTSRQEGVVATQPDADEDGPAAEQLLSGFHEID